jgi:hypothetical protein
MTSIAAVCGELLKRADADDEGLLRWSSEDFSHSAK